MIIHSDFKDYYDSIAKYGVDTTCHYTRHMSVATRKDCGDIKATYFSKSLLDLAKVINAHLDVEYCNRHGRGRVLPVQDRYYPGAALVAGKLYPVLSEFIYCRPVDLTTEKVRRFGFSPGRLTPKYITDNYQALVGHFQSLSTERRWENIGKYQSLESLIGSAFSTVDVGMGLNTQLGSPTLYLLPTIVDHKKNDRSYTYTYAGRGSFYKDDKDWYNTPVAIVNPNLRDLGVDRVLHPYNAFTDIANFVSGVMGGQSQPMVEIADKVRLEKHGFDAKTSFRPNMKR